MDSLASWALLTLGAICYGVYLILKLGSSSSEKSHGSVNTYIKF